MILRMVRVAAAACLTMASAIASSADETVLRLHEAIEQARSLRPELAGFVFESQIQKARARAAVLRPAPELEFVVEDAFGTGVHSGFDAAQTTLSLSQLFELGGKREARVAVADAQQARLRTEQAARQLDVVAEIARAFIETLAQQERVAAAVEALDLTKRVEEAVDERVSAAAAPLAERSRAAVAVTEIALALEDARHVFETARFVLASTMGIARPTFTRVAGDLFELESVPTFGALMAELEAAPDFLRFTDEARLKQAELRLAESRRRADLRVILGVRRLELDDDAALVGGFSLPLYPSRYAAPAIATAQAEFDQVENQRQALLLKARAQLYAHYQEMEHARHVVTVLEENMLPQLALVLEQTEEAWRRGRYSYLEWSDGQRRLLEAHRRRIDAAAEFQLQRIEIERLTGASLLEAGEHP